MPQMRWCDTKRTTTLDEICMRDHAQGGAASSLSKPNISSDLLADTSTELAVVPHQRKTIMFTNIWCGVALPTLPPWHSIYLFREDGVCMYVCPLTIHPCCRNQSHATKARESKWTNERTNAISLSSSAWAITLNFSSTRCFSSLSRWKQQRAFFLTLTALLGERYKNLITVQQRFYLIQHASNYL